MTYFEDSPRLRRQTFSVDLFTPFQEYETLLKFYNLFAWRKKLKLTMKLWFYKVADS